MQQSMGSSGAVEVIRELCDATSLLTREYLASTRRTLTMLLSDPHLLDGVRLERKAASYTRNLLYGSEEMSVWAMVWSPGARTSIHDHHCSCCFGLLKGTVIETRFRAIDERRVVPTERLPRGEGFVDCLLPSGPNIHMMSNEGSEEAISIHVYGYDHRMHSTSALREYEVVPG